MAKLLPQRSVQSIRRSRPAPSSAACCIDYGIAFALVTGQSTIDLSMNVYADIRLGRGPAAGPGLRGRSDLLPLEGAGGPSVRVAAVGRCGDRGRGGLQR